MAPKRAPQLSSCDDTAKSAKQPKESCGIGLAPSNDASVAEATPESVYKYIEDTWGKEAHCDTKKIEWSQVVRDVGVWTQKEARDLYYRQVVIKQPEFVQKFVERGRVSGGVYHPPSWLVADPSDLCAPGPTPETVYKYVEEAWGKEVHSQTWRIDWAKVVSGVEGVSSQKEAKNLYYRHVHADIGDRKPDDTVTPNFSERGRVLDGEYHPPSWLAIE
jgi:hypothetical protein